ncbi:unnamed protein product, partial [Ectocarpus fasciculatus]
MFLCVWRRGHDMYGGAKKSVALLFILPIARRKFFLPRLVVHCVIYETLCSLLAEKRTPPLPGVDYLSAERWGGEYDFRNRIKFLRSFLLLLLLFARPSLPRRSVLCGLVLGGLFSFAASLVVVALVVSLPLSSLSLVLSGGVCLEGP